MKERSTSRTRKYRSPRPAYEPPVKRRKPSELTPLEQYIEDQKKKELERPYDDELPF